MQHQRYEYMGHSITLTTLKLIWFWILMVSFCSAVDNRDFYGSENIQTNDVMMKHESDGGNDFRISRPIEDCIFMALDEGHYHLHSNGKQSSTCGVYILAEPDKQVVLTFDHTDVSCNGGGLVSVVDGWENQGEFFPGISEHGKTIGHRYHEFCGAQKPKNHYLASQNAAMIQYRVPIRGEGFRITVQFIKNLTPCNVLLQGYQGIYTLRNYGQRVNCSVSAVFPAHIDVILLNVGVQGQRSTIDLETGLRSKCQETGANDYVDVVGSNGMDPTKAKPSNSLCGLESYPKDIFANILCGTSTVRLVSSGLFENSISVRFRQMDVDDLMSPHVIMCNDNVS